MPTDTDKKLNGTPEPFRRPVVWGRPPATVNSQLWRAKLLLRQQITERRQKE